MLFALIACFGVWIRRLVSVVWVSRAFFTLWFNCCVVFEVDCVLLIVSC